MLGHAKAIRAATARFSSTIFSEKHGKFRGQCMLQFIDVESGGQPHKIAVEHAPRSSEAPGIMWLGGYRSDMTGSKAQALAHWCAGQGFSCLRHDYSGHGRSGGTFADGCISNWLEGSLAVFDRFASGPQILVGSSMGGWIALLMARELATRGIALHAMLLIAPAPDFTERLLWPSLNDEQRRAILEQGYLEEPSQYSGEPNLYTRKLFEDGRRNLVLDGNLRTHCKVHILQGRQDTAVPWTHAMELAAQLFADPVSMTLVPDGDHRLSRDQDIELMLRVLAQLAA